MSKDYVFEQFIKEKLHHRRQNLLLETGDEDSTILRLENVYQRLFDVHFDGHFDGQHVIGFIDKREPKILGFVSFCYDNLHKIGGADIWLSENMDPSAEAPYMRVGIPDWLRGFNASACASSRYNIDVLDFAATRKIVEDRVVAAITSAAVRLLLSGRAVCETEKDIAIAVCKSPLLHKRLLLCGLYFPTFDVMSADFLSAVHSPIPNVCGLARTRRHRIFCFTNKEEMTLPGMISKFGFLHAHEVEVSVIHQYWPIISGVLRNIISIDGSVVLQLTRDTNIVDFMEPRIREKTAYGPIITRRQEQQALADELSWTWPFLYSEGHLDLAEFLSCMSPQLECPQCKKHPRPRSCRDHYYIILRQARLLSLRLKKELPKEFTWYDEASQTVKTMEKEMTSFPHALLYESIMLPGYPVRNEFLKLCVPCDQPDILPAKLEM